MSAAVDGDRELHAKVAQRLVAGGQRYSTGRRRLVAGLADADRPVTIPELLESLPEMAQSSAYRNLSVLEQVGVVSRIVTFGEHARFELAEDLMGHHHHLICTSCGRVEDFTVPDSVEQTVDEAMASVVAPTGFAPVAHRLDLLGTCRSCQKRAG